MDLEQIETNTDLYKSISEIWSVLKDFAAEMKSLRTDVDKLIENSQGGNYGRTA